MGKSDLLVSTSAHHTTGRLQLTSLTLCRWIFLAKPRYLPEDVEDVDVDPSPYRYYFRQWTRPAAQLQ